MKINIFYEFENLKHEFLVPVFKEVSSTFYSLNEIYLQSGEELSFHKYKNSSQNINILVTTSFEQYLSINEYKIFIRQEDEEECKKMRDKAEDSVEEDNKITADEVEEISVHKNNILSQYINEINFISSDYKNYKQILSDFVLSCIKIQQIDLSNIYVKNKEGIKMNPEFHIYVEKKPLIKLENKLAHLSNLKQTKDNKRFEYSMINENFLICKILDPILKSLLKFYDLKFVDSNQITYDLTFQLNEYFIVPSSNHSIFSSLICQNLYKFDELNLFIKYCDSSKSKYSHQIKTAFCCKLMDLEINAKFNRTLKAIERKGNLDDFNLVLNTLEILPNFFDHRKVFYEKLKNLFEILNKKYSKLFYDDKLINKSQLKTEYLPLGQYRNIDRQPVMSLKRFYYFE
ncbi:hypothetical protein CWI37_0136p0040 [Hamiltosporidium tvaerminnensis]|uniref:Uncharacterized protein n=1 Tax=Hamiltosporidium tvaerminnensis TaxID=1176355 RepID=A0A4Q9LBM6_9MICR|nr:hypothetical protein CWI37_0136p0040 [Hamiltosporidium tvaerminnensis]